MEWTGRNYFSHPFTNLSVFSLPCAVHRSKVGHVPISGGIGHGGHRHYGIWGIIGILVGLGGFIIVSKLADAVRILRRISNTLERIEKQMEEPVIEVR